MTGALSDQNALSRARALVAMRRWQDARTVLRHVIAETPESGEALCLLAQCELGLESASAALQAADAAVAVGPEHEWAHRLRSLALSRLGRHKDSIRAAEVAVGLAPFLWATHARYAEAYVGPRGKRALAAAHRAVELAPNVADAHFCLGIAETRYGRRRRAADAYRRGLAIDPQHSGARNNLALLDMRRSRFGRAASGFGAVLAEDPTFDLARHNIDVVLRTVLFRALLCLAFGMVVVAAVGGSTHPWTINVAAAALLLAMTALAATAALVLLPLRSATTASRRYVVSRARRGRMSWAVRGGLLAALAVPVAAVLPPGRNTLVYVAGILGLAVAFGALLVDGLRAGRKRPGVRLQGRSDYVRIGIVILVLQVVRAVVAHKTG